MNLKKIPIKDLKLLRDWVQFSLENYYQNWVSPSDSYVEEFKEFIEYRTEFYPLNEIAEYVGEAELILYTEELPLLKDMVRLLRKSK